MAPLEKAGLELEAARAGEFVREMGKANKAQDDFASGSVRAAGDIERGTSRIGSAFSTMSVVAIGAAAAAATAVIGIGAKAISSAQSFETGMNKIRAASQNELTAAGFNMQDVQEKALQLGAATQFSSNQALEAMDALLKGGVDVKAVMTDATSAVLTLATATGEDLTFSAELVANQLSVWGRTGINAAQAVDMMTAAVNGSTLDVRTLSEGLAAAGGAAMASGVSFQDLNMALALIRPNFNSGSDAGTGFKTMLQRMVPASDDALALMMELNLATASGKSLFFDQQGAFIGVRASADLLSKALSGLSDEEKNAAVTTIFGADAARAAIGLAQQGAAGYDELAKKVAAAGSATDQAAIQQQGLGFAIESFNGSVETILTTLGLALLPVVTNFLNTFVIPITNGIGAIVTALTQGDIGGAFDLLVENIPIEGLYDFFNMVKMGWNSIVAGATEMVNAIKPVLDEMAVTVLPIIKETLGGAVKDVGAILMDLGAIVGLAFRTIAAYFRDNATEIRQGMTLLFNILKIIFGGGLEIIRGIVRTALQLLSGNWEAAKQAVVDTVENLFVLVNEATGGGLKRMGDAIDNAGREFQEGLREDWARISGEVETAWNGLIAWLNSTLTQFDQFGISVINGIISGLQSAAQSLTTVFGNLIRGAINFAIDLLPPGIRDVVRVGLGLAASSAVASSAQGGGRQSSIVTPAASTGQNSSTINNSRTYNLNVTSATPSAGVISDFTIMQSMGR